jgi:hypothetical protein
MSGGSLVTLARLSEARRVPTSLYRDGWPNAWRRAAQLAFAASQWLFFKRTGWVLYGERLPAAAGKVEIRSTLVFREWLTGAYVMRNAQLTKLNEKLGLDVAGSELYLASADVLVVFGRRNGTPVVVHISADSPRLKRYCDHSEEARRQLGAHGMSEIIPMVLEQRPILDLQMITQKWLRGSKLLTARFSFDEESQLVDAALRPLHALAHSGRHDSAGADSELIASLLKTLGQHCEIGAMVAGPLEALRNWDGRWRLPAVLAHGDYCLTNVLYSEGSDPTVCALVDWEGARFNACAGFDALYFVVFSYAHWRRSTVMGALCDLWQDACDPQLERLLAKIKLTLGLTSDDLRHVALMIWLRHLHQHAPDIAEWSAQRRREWLEEPARCAGQWLRTSELELRKLSADGGAS